MFNDKKIEFYAHLAIVAAILTIFLKSAAYLVTGSVGLLSDAIESLVNLATAIITLFAVKFSQEPEDEQHQFGHYKIEYFSSLAESVFIFIAAISIILTAAERIIHPSEINDLTMGIVISFIASAINGFAAYQMFKAGKVHKSIALKADAHHLMTDVYTSAGVVVAVTLVYYTNILILDPIIAILVGLNILKTSFDLAKKSFNGLMDTSLDDVEREEINTFICNFLINYLNKNEVLFNVKSRVSGKKVFIHANIAIPDNWNIKKSHDPTRDLECSFLDFHPDTILFIHLEPESDFLHEITCPLTKKV